jgi:hypothetical protein
VDMSTAEAARKPRLHRTAVTVALAAVVSTVLLLTALTVSSPARAGSLRASSSLPRLQSHYLKLSQQGLTAASSGRTWWNSGQHWYNRLLTGNTRHPLATIWDVVPVFEIDDDMAIAQRTPPNVDQLNRFAGRAETYWDSHITPTKTSKTAVGAYAPYPHSHNNPKTFFDDNAWWCLAFLDAYDATGNTRYLHDCVRAFDFISAYGWDKADGGMWWNTYHTTRSGEVLGGAAEIAARLYQLTGRPSYLADAVKYISWANHHLLKWDGSYTDDLPNEVIMPHDGEGAMVAAFTALCQAPKSEPVDPGVYAGLPANKTGSHPSFERPDNPKSWCSWAEALASHTAFGVKPSASGGGKTFDAFVPLDEGPQWDAIYVRGLLALYAYDHDKRWYRVAQGAASQILNHAGQHQDGFELFMRGWEGESKINDASPGMLRTHGASVSVFSALATVAPPAG